MKGRPRLDVVIVNWNTGDLLRGTLEHLAAADGDGIGELRAIVVDNASDDDSWRNLEVPGLDVEVIRNDTNLGFAAACNQGARLGDSEYLLFLNPDLHVEADSLSAPIAFMESEAGARAGICGIQLRDEAGRPSPSCARYPTLALEFYEMTGLSRLAPHRFERLIMGPEEHLVDRDVPMVSGAFFLMRRALFDQLDGFDERFFMYCEESDLAKRAWDRGAASRYLASVGARHYGEESSTQVKDLRLFYMLRSRTLFIRKHTPGWRAVVHDILAASLGLVARLAISIGGRSTSSPSQVLRAYRLFYAYLLGRIPER